MTLLPRGSRAVAASLLQLAWAVLPLLPAAASAAPPAPSGDPGAGRGTPVRIDLLERSVTDEGHEALVRSKVRVVSTKTRHLVLLQVQDADGSWRNIDDRGTNKRGIAQLAGRVGEGTFTVRVASPGGRGNLRVTETWVVENPSEVEPPRDYTDEEGVQAVLDAINRARQEHGVPAVVLDGYYSGASQEQAADYARQDTARYIGEYMENYRQHPEFPHDTWTDFFSCFGFVHDPDDFARNTAGKYLDPRWEGIMLGFTRRSPETVGDDEGRWSLSVTMFQRDYENQVYDR